MKGKIKETISFMIHKDNYADYSIVYNDRFKGETLINLVDYQVKVINNFILLKKEEIETVLPMHRIRKISKEDKILFER